MHAPEGRGLDSSGGCRHRLSRPASKHGGGLAVHLLQRPAAGTGGPPRQSPAEVHRLHGGLGAEGAPPRPHALPAGPGDAGGRPARPGPRRGLGQACPASAVADCRARPARVRRLAARAPADGGHLAPDRGPQALQQPADSGPVPLGARRGAPPGGRAVGGSGLVPLQLVLLLVRADVRVAGKHLRGGLPPRGAPRGGPPGLREARRGVRHDVQGAGQQVVGQQVVGHAGASLRPRGPVPPGNGHRAVHPRGVRRQCRRTLQGRQARQ
mmetsp:Transcript_18855/g.53126  ORF Transcript_18855/g.53126 Transcript_18855/m.53126 type:complete len:268 (+) Transcript_18855:2460-3263(+)